MTPVPPPSEYPPPVQHDGPPPLDDYPPPIDPDCLAGKHHACHGRAWDFEADDEVQCACGCHEITNVVESL